MKDKPTRTVVKTISWRILATLVTMTLVLIFTKELTLAAGVGALDIITKMVLYYGHERAWNNVNWGKN